MNHQPPTTKLKLLAKSLLLLLTLTFINCEKDNILDSGESAIDEIKHPKIKYFTQTTVPESVTESLSYALSPKNTKYTSNNLETSFGTILTDVIMQTINDDGIENYTYKIVVNDDDPKTFYNLILRKNADGTFSEPYIKQYIMTDAFYESYSIGEATFGNFEGSFVNYNVTENINISDLPTYTVDSETTCPPVPVEGDDTSSEDTNNDTATGSGGSGGDGRVIQVTLLDQAQQQVEQDYLVHGVLLQ